MAGALQMADESFRLRASAFDASEAGDLRLKRVEFIRGLRCVRITRRALPGFSPRDVYIISGREHQRVFAVRDLVVIEPELPAQAEPCIVGECGNRAVIAMAVNGPVREEDIGLLGLEQPPKFLIMSGVDNRIPIAVRRKGGAGFEYFAGFPGFRDAHPAARARIFLRTTLLAAIQIQQDDLMSQIRVARNRAAAAILGIAGMTAANHHLELVIGAERLHKSTRERDCGYRGDQPPAGNEIHPSIFGQIPPSE